VQTRGRPPNRQPKSSTARDPSSFERSAVLTRQRRLSDTEPLRPSGSLGKWARQGVREAGTGGDENSGEDEYCDPSEDELMYQELERLVRSGGSSELMWTKELDLAGMTQATRAYSLRKRNRKE
jgi:hypothetical protein